MTSFEKNNAKDNIYLPHEAIILKTQVTSKLEKHFTLKNADGSKLLFEPGQFLEVSLFGYGEIPIGLASTPTRENSFDIVVLTEVIEHMSYKESQEMLDKILSSKKVKHVVITTPNRDFNSFYSDAGVMRREDHVFEFSESDFKKWLGNRGRSLLFNIGDVVERQLRDGDYLLLNRQPTLHAGSMQAMQIKVKDCSTIRINLSICRSFNADFDLIRISF